MSNSLFMGIDIGTSGVRAALFDSLGNEASLCHKEYSVICTEQGMAEIDPDIVFESMLEVVKCCVEQAGSASGRIEAIGMSSQMHSILAVDASGGRLTNAVTWADTRAVKYADFIKSNHDYNEFYNRTGCRVQHPAYPLSKILWLKKERPDTFKKASKFITIKEYIVNKLFGEYVIDISDASSTGCFNIHSFSWDKGILKDVLGIDDSRFSNAVDCTYMLKGIKGEYAEKMGISGGTPFVIGSTDGIMANLGSGVFDSTSMSCTIGTSGALRIASDKPILDKEQKTWCYCFTKDTWVAGGAINNGGIVLKWLRETYRKQYELEAKEAGIKSVYKLFDKYAEEINPGSDGLIFLPYFTGDRAPIWNANAKATFHGITLMHGRKHFIRAAMESVMFCMLSVYEVLTALNNSVSRIMANGGYINSQIWLQIQADIFDKEIAVAGIGESSVFGAAYTAMVALGAIPSFRHPLVKMQPSKVVKPSGQGREVYARCFNEFKELYSKIYNV